MGECVLNILFLCGDLNNFGGTERVSSIIANGLSDSGYSVCMTSILNGDKPFFPLNDKVKVTSLTNSNARVLYQMPKIIWNLRKLLKDEDIDILIVVDTMSVLFSIPAVAGLPVKHIGWEHFSFNNNLGKKGRSISRQLAARYCDSIVTLTERDKKYWLQGTRHKSQIMAIANPCPFPVQECIEKENTKIVLAVGRLVSQKGFDMLLEAWVKVTKDAPDWKLKIVGDGKEKNNLHNFIIENELTESVEMLGSTDNVKKYYKEAEIFCLSSRYEGFGMVLIEALAFGLPIVSFDCEAGPEEVLEGTGSILVPSNNIDLLASALLDLINDEELRKTISVKSKDKVEKYHPLQIVLQWEKLIESLK
jgi:glycosyltransferase involved in cell wall biosynthesis